MSMPSSTPAIGCEVFTVDGDKLGTVKEVQGTYFKVTPPCSLTIGSPLNVFAVAPLRAECPSPSRRANSTPTSASSTAAGRFSFSPSF